MRIKVSVSMEFLLVVRSLYRFLSSCVSCVRTGNVNMSSKCTMLSSSPFIVQLQIALIGIIVILGMFFMWRYISRIEERIEKVARDCSCMKQARKPVMAANPTASNVCGSSSANVCGNSANVGGSCVNVGGSSSGGGVGKSNWVDYEKVSSAFPEEDEYAEEMLRVFGELSDSLSVPTFVMSSKNGYAPRDRFVVVEDFVEGGGVEEVEEVEGLVEEVKEDEVGGLIEEVDRDAAGVANVEVHTASGITNVADNFSEADTDADAENPLSKSKLRKMTVDKLKDLCAERNLSSEGSKATIIDRILGIVRD